MGTSAKIPGLYQRHDHVQRELHAGAQIPTSRLVSAIRIIYLLTYFNMTKKTLLTLNSTAMSTLCDISAVQWRHQSVTAVLQPVASPGRHHCASTSGVTRASPPCALPVPRAAFPIALRTSLRTKRVRCGCQGRCQEIWRGGGVPFKPTIEKWSSVKATQSVVGFPTRGPYCSTGSGFIWGLTSDF